MRTHLLALAILVAFMATSASHAAEGGGGKYVGLTLGFARPSTTSTAPVIGLDAAYRINSLGVGFVIQKFGVSAALTSSTAETTTVTASSSATILGPQLIYYFGGGFNAGLRTGLAKTTTTSEATDGTSTITIDDSSSGLYLAPRAGYDHFLGSFSVGGELQYLYGMGSGPRALMLLLNAKFWF